MKLVIKFYKTSDMVLTNFSDPSVKNEQKNGRTDGLTIIIEYFLSLDIGQVNSFLNKAFYKFLWSSIFYSGDLILQCLYQIKWLRIFPLLFFFLRLYSPFETWGLCLSYYLFIFKYLVFCHCVSVEKKRFVENTFFFGNNCEIFQVNITIYF